MSKLAIKASATSRKVRVFIQDSSSTTGAGLTGLAFGTSGLTAYYLKEGDSSMTSITLVTATLGTWTSGGFIAVDGTHAPGLYELGIPNAALTALGAMEIYLQGAANMAPCVLEIQVVAYDPEDATRLGLTALPNANAEAAGGLYTRGTGAGQIKQTNNGEIDSNATHVNNIATTSVTTVSAIVGTTQAIAFNANNFAKVSLNDILATTLTETSGQLAGGFKQWFNVATPTGTVNSLPNAAPGAAGGVFIAGSNAATTFASLTVTTTTTLTGAVSLGSTLGVAGTTTLAALTQVGAVSWGATTWASTTITSGTIPTDVQTIKTNPVVNAGTITFPTGATLASTTNITAGTITTTTNLTNLPSIPSNWLTAAGIAADTGLKPIRSNTAAAGGSTSITLDAGASSTNSFYVNDLVYLTGGTGAGQARFITAYVGGTQVATVTAWTTNPDNTTTFAILPFDAIPGATAPTTAQIVTAIMTDLLSGSNYNTSGSYGKLIKDDIDAAVSSRMATYSQPTGFLAATFPTGTIANTTNITAGTITTTTNLTNMPSIPSNWITAAGITAGALNGKGDWNTTTPPTVAAIATGVWTDTTAGDFTVSASIGKSIMNGVPLGTGLTINAYTGDTPQTGDAYAVVNNGTFGNSAIHTQIGTPQQSGVAVTLPANPPSSFLISGSFASGCDFTTTMKSSLNAATVTVSDKTGFSLAASGLDAITTTAPTGPAANFRQMVVQLWRRFFRKSTLTSTQLKTYADDDTTVATTQAVSDDGTTQTQGDAS